MPASHSSSKNGDTDPSTNILLAALQEMDAIIAESKFCLDNMSDSPATSYRNGHTGSPDEYPRMGLSVDNLSQSLNFLTTDGNGASPGNLSKLGSDMPSVSKSIPRIIGHQVPTATSGPSLLVQLAEELKEQIKLSAGDADARKLSQDTRRALEIWLGGAGNGVGPQKSKTNGSVADHLGDAVKRLEAERNGLQRQLSFIGDQMSCQTDKIRELQDLLRERTCQLQSTEALLREEMLTRSSLETRKLDLLTEVKDMRAQILAAEREMLSPENRLPSRIKETHLLQNGLAHEYLLDAGKSSAGNGIMSPKSRSVTENQQDKMMQLLKAKLDEKDLRIRQLEELLKQQLNGVRPIVNGGTSNGLSNGKPVDSRDGGRKPPHAARPYNTLCTNSHRLHPLTVASLAHSNSVGSDDSLSKYADSLPASDGNAVSMSNSGSHRERRRESSSRSSAYNAASRSRSTDARPARSGSGKRSSNSSFRSPLSPSKSFGEKLSLLSASSSWSFLRQRSSSNTNAPVTGLFVQQEVNRSSSVPNLGRVGSESERLRCSTPKSGSSDTERKQSGLRKFFEKLTRNNSSSTLNEIPATPQAFKRGGVRATAGARLQRPNGFQKKWDPNVPMKHWNQEQIVQWLEEEVQLPITVTGKAWIGDGERFLKATPAELEKELNLYHPLHKKKLILALKALDETEDNSMGKLDYLWVLRWLDDVGLPQYKDAFADARVDGRMLNFLTTEDLFLLKISNALHHASLKRGIQVLRHSRYDPSSIRRRPVKSEVLAWTRSAQIRGVWLSLVWLPCASAKLSKTIEDSAGEPRRGNTLEQPSNDGMAALFGPVRVRTELILEERFSADVLAELLSIPHSKTLLRRHLSKSFTELVGTEIIRQKRAAEAAPGYVPLSTHLKLKPTRKGFTLVRRRGKFDTEFNDYVCPLDLKVDFTSFLIKSEPPRPESKDAEEGKSLSSHSNNQLSVPSPIVLSLTV